jgi:hypothetical protein
MCHGQASGMLSGDGPVMVCAPRIIASGWSSARTIHHKRIDSFIYRRWPTNGTLAVDAFMTEFLDRQP